MSPESETAPVPCLVCGKPLSEGETHLSRRWHFDCQKCQYCGHETTYDILEKCISEGRKPAHATCYKTHLFSEFQTKDLVIRLEHVNLLNAEINSFFPAVDPNHVDIEGLYEILKSLQATAAAVSYALGVTKDKLQIQRSSSFNHEQTQKKIEKLQTARADAESEIEKQKRAAMLAEERENPELRARRKTIEGLQKTFKLGTFAEAEAMLDSMMAQAAPRKTQTQ